MEGIKVMETADQQTEDRILEAAHRVFVRRGTAGARTQEIADEAGVNKALLHYYFRTKEKLAEAVFLRAARLLFPRMLAVLGSNLPLREKLEQAVATELELLAQHPYLPGYILSELQYQPDRMTALIEAAGVAAERRRAVLPALQRSIDDEVAAGRIRRVAPEQIIVNLMSLVIFPHVALPVAGAVLGLSEAQKMTVLSWRRTDLADFILRGLSPD